MNDVRKASQHLRQITQRPYRSMGKLWPDVTPALSQRLVHDMEDDSRYLQPGDAWLCLVPDHPELDRFMQQAADADATLCIAVGRLPGTSYPLPVLELAGMDELAALLRRWFGTESTSVRCVGITGTDGKTSVAWMSRLALQATGRCAWSAGTLGWINHDGYCLRLGNTTTSLLNNHRLLAAADSAGVDALVMEVSSHGIDQQRIAGMPFASLVWTTMGRDHLDYHHDAAAYIRCKSSFVHHYAQQGAKLIVNADQPEIMAETADLQRLSYGRETHAWLRWSIPAEGCLQLACDNQQWQVDDVPAGDIHAQNMAAACTVLYSLGLPLAEAVTALQGMTAPPGRLEIISDDTGRQVLVDYAHTAQALAVSLKTARSMCASSGYLLLVFGCGGERDREKRSQMGTVAAELADAVWLTSDNPRGEDPARIIADIRRGMAHIPVVVYVGEDREQVIARAIAYMRAGDTLLIAGKGHEDYMEFADGRRVNWSDAALARQYLEATPC